MRNARAKAEDKPASPLALKGGSLRRVLFCQGRQPADPRAIQDRAYLARHVCYQLYAAKPAHSCIFRLKSERDDLDKRSNRCIVYMTNIFFQSYRQINQITNIERTRT